eukprot:CAMPEP_0181285056 /NCGR_PEP_ID=MMETSP1097-20121128/15764_1 /TAXON_ID=35684 /ORGANISM="Pseudopedinella elastica, Strain CCMP716" /LENGTH=140 /DNA_ID=CAMNT_0023388593 /DNA_START=9 /DNA_END=428 /DNA_ORIENTATION=-
MEELVAPAHLRRSVVTRLGVLEPLAFDDQPAFANDLASVKILVFCLLHGLGQAHNPVVALEPPLVQVHLHGVEVPRLELLAEGRQRSGLSLHLHGVGRRELDGRGLMIEALDDEAVREIALGGSAARACAKSAAGEDALP